MIDNNTIIVVGAGLTGAVIANSICSLTDKKVLIIEKESEVGGLCRDGFTAKGNFCQFNGPHIFRTRNYLLMNFVKSYSNWIRIYHYVDCYLKRRYYSFPLSIRTLEELHDKEYNKRSAIEYLNKQRVTYKVIKNAEEQALSMFGEELYELFIKGYTTKQWGKEPKYLSPEITARIRFNFDRSRHFSGHTDTYLPRNGYTYFIKELVKHHNIKILTNTDFLQVKDDFIGRYQIFYTGRPDELFDYEYGRLTYRKVFYEHKEYSNTYRQTVPIINYPNEREYVRSSEIKHFINYGQKGTLVTYDYPGREDGVSAYPIPSIDNFSNLMGYIHLGRSKNIIFAGRLGEHKYLDMDKAIENAWTIVKQNILK